MRVLFSLVLVALALYAGIVALFYLGQGALLYPAGREKVGARAAGLFDFEDVALSTEDGETIVAWYKPAEPGRATLLYFHGNGGSLLNRRDRAKLLTEAGRGLLLVSYRGYSGSTGKPGEAGLRTDARTAYEWLRARVPADSIVLYGESLGSGVAVGLATERPVDGLILDAPFTSTADVAGHHYWYLPVWLLRDQYRSIDRIHELRCPLLVIHGDRDGVIPIALGERLFAAAPEPKRFVTLPGVDHVSVLERGGLEPVRAFLESIEKRPS
ncbi:MAG TPA: alpha/beta hydrolase [Beijerinckiaceae bacterium]|nr:alpha/beta hydrolase [Beijerinckiaceae bacterium]